MQYAFIFKNSNKKQKADANNEESGVKLDDIYRKVMSGVLTKLFEGGGSEK
jgi:hypothetical protein